MAGVRSPRSAALLVAAVAAAACATPAVAPAPSVPAIVLTPGEALVAGVPSSTVIAQALFDLAGADADRVLRAHGVLRGADPSATVRLRAMAAAAPPGSTERLEALSVLVARGEAALPDAGTEVPVRLHEIVREETSGFGRIVAVARLREMGPGATPALEEAARGTGATARAAAAVLALGGRPAPLADEAHP